MPEPPSTTCSMSSVYVETTGSQACAQRGCAVPRVLGGTTVTCACLLAFKMVLERFKVKNNPTPYDLGLLHPGVAPMLSAWISKSWY